MARLRTTVTFSDKIKYPLYARVSAYKAGVKIGQAVAQIYSVADRSNVLFDLGDYVPESDFPTGITTKVEYLDGNVYRDITLMPQKTVLPADNKWGIFFNGYKVGIR